MHTFFTYLPLLLAALPVAPVTGRHIPNVVLYNGQDATQNAAVVVDALRLEKRDGADANVENAEHTVKSTSTTHKKAAHSKTTTKAKGKKTTETTKPAHKTTKTTTHHGKTTTHHSESASHHSSSTTHHASSKQVQQSSTTVTSHRSSAQSASSHTGPTTKESSSVSTSHVSSSHASSTHTTVLAPFPTGNSTAPRINIAAAIKSTTTTKKVTTSVKSAASRKSSTTTTTTKAATKKTTTSTATKPTDTVVKVVKPVAEVSKDYSGGKRGLAFNLANMTKPFGGSKSQVTWAYNWYTSACGGDEDCAFNKNLDYIPMLFNDAASATSTWPATVSAALKGGSSALFSFNEPDVCYSGSACMPVASAVAAYKKYMNPYAGKIALGAPAVTNGAAPYGLTYLQQFLKKCPKCHVDFINVHWYSNKYAGATYFEEYMLEVKKVANGRPVWVTEYGLTDENPYTTAELVQFLKTTMAWMDQQPWIHRYAYFMDEAGVLMGPAGKHRSTAGNVYNNYVNKTVQANLA